MDLVRIDPPVYVETYRIDLLHRRPVAFLDDTGQIRKNRIDRIRRFSLQPECRFRR